MSRASERGAGSMLVVGVCAALGAVMFMATILISWFAQIRHAEQAAELAALGAVAAAVRGDDPCPAGEEVARANQVTLSGCRVLGVAPDVVVIAEVSVDLQPAAELWPGGELVRQATAGSR
ncbi:Rv3654c family TadE-like protein [Tessaracoccus caeni]|uniref:Rv3654c family TadE-like protein n=1 Tax=Tessaracoccus caeni TaxID=3031239 RepID=UPI0023DB3338|nr:Rv3654c family TadE-like protein [Tessaracoccus caeni]MDF1487679.1 flp pilus-assembly TadE/G-like family protein [Tessaracoccus caeni]